MGIIYGLGLRIWVGDMGIGKDLGITPVGLQGNKYIDT